MRASLFLTQLVAAVSIAFLISIVPLHLTYAQESQAAGMCLGDGCAAAGLTLGGVVSNIIGLINQIIPVLFALAMVFFLWSCVRYITQAGEGGGEVRSQILWGIIALVVIFSIWGLVNILCLTLLGTSCGR